MKNMEAFAEINPPRPMALQLCRPQGNGKLLTKPSKYGTLYLFDCVYRDPTDASFGEARARYWAYNLEHVSNIWADHACFDGFELVSAKRVRVSQ